MYEKIFSNLGGLCYKISHASALVYAYLIHQAQHDGSSLCAKNIICGALNLEYADVSKCLDELVEAELIDLFYKDIVIAEISGSAIYSTALYCDISEYRDSRILKRLNPDVWEKIRKEIFERDDYTCSYCGERGGILECDHIVPINQGGTNESGNLTTACKKCNASKRDKLLKDWRGAA